MQIRGGGMDEILVSETEDLMMPDFNIGITGKRIWGVIAGYRPLSQRGYNIESLTVAPMDDPALSRMTIQTVGDEKVLEQVKSNCTSWLMLTRVSEAGTRERTLSGKSCW